MPDDSSMMYAAAYLTVKYPIPEIRSMDPDNDKDFPFWIAVDKHTSAGREVYFKKVVGKAGLTEDFKFHILRAGFGSYLLRKGIYFEASWAFLDSCYRETLCFT